jgi:hypothetical protein
MCVSDIQPSEGRRFFPELADAASLTQAENRQLPRMEFKLDPAQSVVALNLWEEANFPQIQGGPQMLSPMRVGLDIEVLGNQSFVTP